MSNYLETLVENMVADGVSEKDIKSVIEEVNSKKSPLHQDISGTTVEQETEGQDISITTGDISTDIDTTVVSEEISDKEGSDK